jgi:hypothetical protein
VWLWFKNEAWTAEALRRGQIDLSPMDKVNASYNSLLSGLLKIKEKIEDFEGKIEDKPEITKEEGIYKGEIGKNQRQGIGRQRTPSNSYIGQWFEDRKNGIGMGDWEDGSKFIGTLKDSIKDGIGEYVWPDQNFYIGEWENDVMHGVGKYCFSDGRVYLGNWSQGLMSGFGVFSWPDGRKFEGLWRNGKKHGLGTTFNSDGSAVVSQWDAGRIIPTGSSYFNL